MTMMAGERTPFFPHVAPAYGVILPTPVKNSNDF
jgi:hypothetical protein